MCGQCGTEMSEACQNVSTRLTYYPKLSQACESSSYTLVHGYVRNGYSISADGDCADGDCGEGNCGEGDCGEGDCGEGDCGEGEWIPLFDACS